VAAKETLLNWCDVISYSPNYTINDIQPKLWKEEKHLSSAPL